MRRAWTRSSLLSGNNDFTLTNASVGLRWDTPALIGRWFRPNIELRGDVFNLLSLHRELVKIGLFADVGVFGEIQRPAALDPTDPGYAPLSARSPHDEEVAFLFAFGPSAHLLVLDSFQIDAFYGFGFRESGDYDGRFSFSLTKVY